jgi:hypothetical protein
VLIAPQGGPAYCDSSTRSPQLFSSSVDAGSALGCVADPRSLGERPAGGGLRLALCLDVLDHPLIFVACFAQLLDMLLGDDQGENKSISQKVSIAAMMHWTDASQISSRIKALSSPRVPDLSDQQLALIAVVLDKLWVVTAQPTH